MSLWATLHLVLCGRASSARGGFRGEDEGLEKVGVVGLGRRRRVGGCVCIHQPTPGLWSMKEAPQKTAAARHSDKTLQIVSLIKNLSCRNTIDSKRGRENRQPEPCSPPTPRLHPPTYTDLLSLSFCLSLVPKLHPKTMHTTHQSKDGRRLWGGWPCVSRIVNRFSLSLPPSPLCH